MANGVATNRKAAAIGSAIAAVVTVGGTALTQALWTGEPIGTVKLASCWLMAGALAGRIYYNTQTPKPDIPPAV